ncbi:MAG TPA: PAS domain S-box protein [Anaerolineaceae bacterium]|nr:PAS domain S-box protein [Anaerolineaceae bacterium]
MPDQSSDPGEARYHALLELFPDAILAARLDGSVEYADRKALELFGAIRVEQLIGISTLQVIAPEDRATVHAETERVKAGQPSRWFEVRAKPLSGADKIVEMSVALIRDQWGNPDGILCMARDITNRKRTEEELRFRRALYGDILEDQVELISRFDPDGKLTYCNGAYAQFFTQPEEEVVGKYLKALVFPLSECERLFERLRKLTPENPMVVNTHPEYRLDGDLRWLEWTNRAIFDAEGTLLEYQGVGRDVTQQVLLNEELERRVQQRTRELETVNRELANEITIRKASEEALRGSETRYRTLAEASRDYIIVLTEDGKIEYANNRVAGLIKQPPEDILGHFPEEFLISPQLPSQRLLLKQVLETREAVYMETSLQISDQYLWLGSWFIPIINIERSRSSVMVVSRDITDQMQDQNRLEKTLENERELGELKTRFISMTSHEFRTPLSTILSSAELLEHYWAKFSEQKRLDHLKRIEGAVNHLTTMLDEVLTIGKADAGRVVVQPKEMDLVEFCHGYLEEIQMGEGKDHRIQFYSAGSEIPVCLDDALLRQVLGNLLSNAIKYSPPGSSIWLQAQAGEDQVELIVGDEGIGIPEEDRERLFEPFFRGVKVSHIPGTGLGLTIVQRSVDLMHGSVQVESGAVAGSVFKVLLPRRLEVDVKPDSIEEPWEPGEETDSEKY